MADPGSVMRVVGHGEVQGGYTLFEGVSEGIWGGSPTHYFAKIA